MYQSVKPIPLSAEQIERIQLAGRIIEQERRLEKAIADTGVRWFLDQVSDATLEAVIADYAMLRLAHPALPI